MQVTAAFGFSRAEETVSGGELGHDEAASRLLFLFRNRWPEPLWPKTLAHLWRRHDLLRSAYKAGITDEPAEHRIGYARHRSKNRGRLNTQAADLQTLRYARAWRHRGGASGRIFPEFMHGSQ